MVPMAARPTLTPDLAASFQSRSGRFSTTSWMAEVMSTDRSITAPEAPMKMEAIKIWVRFRWA